MSWDFSLRDLFRAPQTPPRTATTGPLTSTPSALPQSPAQEEPEQTQTELETQDQGSNQRFAGQGVETNRFNFSPVISAGTEGAPEMQLGDYIADSDNIIGSDQNNSPLAASGGISDEGDQLRRLNNNQAKKALEDGVQDPALRETAIQKMEALRGSVPNNDRQRGEFNAYIDALASNPNVSDQQLVDVLDKGIAMMNNPNYHAQLPNHEVMLSALHDVAIPSNISQRNVGACMAGSAQIQMAESDPARYMGLVDTLAAGGSANIGGVEVKANMSFLQETGANRYRTPSTALVQNALMDAMDGTRPYTSAAIDITGKSDAELQDQGISRRNGDSTTEGIMGTSPSRDNMARLDSMLSDFTGRSLSHQRTATNSGDIDQNANNAMIQRIADLNPPPSKDNAVLIYMDWSAAGDGDHAVHAVNIIGIENGQARIQNPWGQEELISLTDLQQRMRGALVP